MIKYNKHLKTAIGSGWDNRPKGLQPTSAVLHTTSNRNPTSFKHEFDYITKSEAVSYHFLIAKDGDIYNILPIEKRAWHAGSCIVPFINSRSVGVAFHTSLGEVVTSQQLAAAATVVRDLGFLEHLIGTHRAVALPLGRKSDPAGLSNADFVAWRNGIYYMNTFRVIGTRPTVTLAQFLLWLRRYKAPIDGIVGGRIYSLCEQLDIDPAFVAGIWKHETSQIAGQIGSSDLYQKSFNAGAIVAYGRWPYVIHNKRRFNKYESPQLGLMHLVMHLKQFYGAAGLLDLDDIIKVYAPSEDGNSPTSYAADVRRSITEMQLQ